MTLATWLILALMAGALAKILTPGRDVISWPGTPVLGLAGMFVGHNLATLLQVDAMSEADIASVIAATAGAMLVYAGYRLVIGASTSA